MFLLPLGFVTPSGYVKCTLLEFNMFRQWIRKLKLDKIRQEMRREREAEKENWKEKQAKLLLLRDGELYNILRSREQQAREIRERRMIRREADRQKYLKLQEIDRKRREKHREELRRQKDSIEHQREKNLADKEVQKIEEEDKVCFAFIMHHIELNDRSKRGAIYLGLSLRKYLGREQSLHSLN